ncbi:MAG: hypothetical protein HONDAALG_03796 [Gammaproteobacteria bacterium]|nr:hypothetical protein [Gammaproteobacteria bacterium]
MSDYDQQNQSVKTQFNIGRDQVIHNLVLVGQLLDFAKVEGLLPKPSATSMDFTKILQSVEKNIDKQIENNLGFAAAFAGQILQNIVKKFDPKESLAIVPIKSILKELPSQIKYSLQHLNYWEAYAVKKMDYFKGYQRTGIVLDSLNTIWNKRFGQVRTFMITDYPELIYFAWNTRSKIVEIEELTIAESQVITLGIAIDLMRLYMIAENDMRTWRGIMKSFGLNK